MNQILFGKYPAIEISSKHLNNNINKKIVSTKCFTCKKCLGTLCWTEKLCINFSEYEKDEIEIFNDD